MGMSEGLHVFGQNYNILNLVMLQDKGSGDHQNHYHSCFTIFAVVAIFRSNCLVPTLTDTNKIAKNTSSF